MADDDTTRVADEPPADYFRPLKKRATCNCGAKPGRPVAECAECAPAPSVEEPEGERDTAEPIAREWQPLPHGSGGYWVRRRNPDGSTDWIGYPLLFNDARILAAYHNGKLHESGDSPEHRQLTELRAENERLKNRMASREAEFDKLIDESASKYADMIIEQLKGVIDDHQPAPAPPAETGEAASEYEVGDIGVGHICILKSGKVLTNREAMAAVDWLNRRAEIDAQLATYKQQAEAWEAVRKHAITVSPISVKEGQYARIMFLNKAGLRESRYERWEELQPAVLALARQLESQQPSDGKEKR